MKKSFIENIVCLILAAFIVSSCAPLPPPGTALTPEERASAQKTCIAQYTAIGALGGAVVGALASRHNRGTGALIGAAAGGGLAFLLAWGHCMNLYSDLRSYPAAGAQETAQKIGYNPSQGAVTKIDSFYLNPEGIAPGGHIKLLGSYYIMDSGNAKEVKVTETRTVSFFDTSENQWKELGSVDQEVTAALGTRNAEGNFDMPADVPEGKYRITFKVDANGKQDQVTRELMVKKGLAMGPSASYAQNTAGGSKAVGKPAPAAAARKVQAEVLTKTLTVRKAPSGKADLLATVNKGELYEAVKKTVAEDKEWISIRLDDGNMGWVLSKYVKLRE